MCQACHRRKAVTPSLMLDSWRMCSAARTHCRCWRRRTSARASTMRAVFGFMRRFPFAFTTEGGNCSSAAGSFALVGALAGLAVAVWTSWSSGRTATGICCAWRRSVARRSPHRIQRRKHTRSLTRAAKRHQCSSCRRSISTSAMSQSCSRYSGWSRHSSRPACVAMRPRRCASSIAATRSSVTVSRRRRSASFGSTFRAGSSSSCPVGPALA
mmetsp:Transcript_21320/g.66121  ORF Transcript_21320/g.66121 Transcript_21320/m.66121 type:complete len:213 (-) Transcript_21320:446-1084(-)